MLMEEVVIIETRQGSLPGSKCKVVKHKPNHCKFPVISLPWELIILPDITISKQARNLLGANMQLFEFNANKGAKVTCRIIKPSIFVFFQLCGEITYYSENGLLITKVNKPTYYLTYGPSIAFNMVYGKGHHAILAIALENDWFSSTTESFPAIENLILAMQNTSKIPMVLPHMSITKDVWHILGAADFLYSWSLPVP